MAAMGKAALSAATLILAASWTPAVSAQTAPSAATTQTPAPAKKKPNAEEMQQLLRTAQGSADRGVQLYRYDRAAWEATDAMLRDIPQDKLPAKAAGWVTTAAPEGLRTIFYETLDDGTSRGFYKSVWNDRQISGKRLIEPAEQQLNAEELRLIKLRHQPLPPAFQPCTQGNINIVILPASGAGAEAVDSIYYLTPQPSATSFPFGGHYRVDYRDGTKVGERAFAKSCIFLDSAETDNRKSTMMFITHSLDPTPTEIHSFEMLSMNLPVAVMATQSKITWILSPVAGKAQVALGPEIGNN